MKAETLLQQFREKGTKKKISSTTFLSLSTPGKVWALEGAPLNLFGIDQKKSSQVRYFLSSFEAPLFFALTPPEGIDLLSVSSDETIAYELSLDALEGDPEELAGYLQEWYEPLFLCLGKSFERSTLDILSPDETEIPKGHIFSLTKSEARKSKFWIETLDGKLLLFGREDLAVKICPLTEHTWFHAVETSKIAVADSLTLIQNHAWKKALSSLSELFGKLLSHALLQKEKEELELLAERSKEQEENVDLALKQLEEVLTLPQVPIVKKTEEDLKQACLLMGSFLKIDFVFPQKAFETEEMEEQLSNICEASQIQKRKVKLEEEWWTSDHGALLGFHKEKPVVLLNSAPHRYEMVDANQKIPVTREVAKELSETAFMLYRPLPEEILSGKELFSFLIKNYLKPIFSIFTYSAIGGVFAFFFPIATKLIFRYALPKNDLPLLFYLTLGLLFSAVGIASFSFFRNFAFLRLEGFAGHFIESALWNRLLSLPLPFFHRYSAGNLFWRISALEEIRTLLTGNIANLLFSGIFSFFYLIIMAVYSPLLTAVALGFALLGVGITAICALFKVNILHTFLELQGQIKGFMIQTISGIAKLRTSGAEKNAFSHWASLFAKNKSLELASQNLQNIVTVTAALCPILTFWGIYATLIGYLGVQSLSLPDFLAFNAGLGSFFLAVYPLITTAIQVCNVFPLWKRTKVILEEPPEIRKEKSLPGHLAGNILVDSVVFRYADSPLIFNGISLEVKAHEFIAIVGPSGCGKSTLLRLLLGLEKPLSGGVYYDGKELSSLNVRAVRKQIGTILQGDQLSSGSLYENLTCGKSYSREEVLHAIHLAGFEKDFENLPMGFHTYIPMNGATFSGGQKQRILLARALLAQPSLLLFDEATSALDNRTQQMIMDHICDLNLSRIFVAQRLSTVRRADRIYVIEKGVIIQTGSFDELAKSPGLFAEMLARQRL